MFAAADRRLAQVGDVAVPVALESRYARAAL